MLASLKVLLHHLGLRQSRLKFVEADGTRFRILGFPYDFSPPPRLTTSAGATILLKILTLTELFPKPLIETCALVMSRIATSEELANAMVGSGITNLIKVCIVYMFALTSRLLDRTDAPGPAAEYNAAAVRGTDNQDSVAGRQEQADHLRGGRHSAIEHAAQEPRRAGHPRDDGEPCHPHAQQIHSQGTSISHFTSIEIVICNLLTHARLGASSRGCEQPHHAARAFEGGDLPPIRPYARKLGARSRGRRCDHEGSLWRCCVCSHRSP